VQLADNGARIDIVRPGAAKKKRGVQNGGQEERSKERSKERKERNTEEVKPISPLGRRALATRLPFFI